MKQTPIKYIDIMLKARKNGRKTQTRRLIDPQPEYGIQSCEYASTGFSLEDEHRGCRCLSGGEVKSPFGNVGDTLIVCDEDGKDTGGRDEINRVWVERVQRIDEECATLEGVEGVLVPPDGGSMPCYEGFSNLWDSIYGNWDQNPWVWCYQFEVIK